MNKGEREKEKKQSFIGNKITYKLSFMSIFYIFYLLILFFG